MRQFLIVSPRFPPSNAADMHRVRVSLGHYRRFGWEPTVLCIDPATSDCAEDPMLARALAKEVRVVRVRAWDEKKCRRFGFGQLGWRSLLPLLRAGNRLFRERRYEVAFFSTTVFTSFALARWWKRRFGCRVVLDFQDPWYAETVPYTPADAPGGWRKYRLDRMLARRLEPLALRAADHVISVSQGYVTALADRYPWLDRSGFSVIPFAAEPEDYRLVAEGPVRQTLLAVDRQRLHWISAGRAGPDMSPILNVLFSCVADLKAREPGFAESLRLDFVGTNYAPPDRTRKLVEPLANAFRLGEIVREHPLRVPYFEALSLYRNSDAILLIGSVHADYTMSKLFPCILAKKPILALLHGGSGAMPVASQFPNIFVAAFDGSPAEPQFRVKVAEGLQWLRTARFDSAEIDGLMRPWSAETLTQAQCAIFDRVTLPCCN